MTNKNKIINLSIALLSIITSFLLMNYFNQFGTKIDYKNFEYMSKMFLSYLPLLIGIYFGMKTLSTKKEALKTVFFFLILFVVSFFIGWLMH